MNMAGSELEVQWTKKPWQSKMLMLNGVAGLLCFVALFVPQADVVSDLIKNNPQAVGLVWGVLNVALRLITKDKISLSE